MYKCQELENYFEKKFELGFFEMNKFGEASPATVLTLLEETAAEHCYAINHGLYDLIKQNIGWVLVSGVMQIDRYPKYRECITIRTWLSDYSTIKGTRENIIYDQQGKIIGRAKGLWVFYDILRKRPIRIFDEIKTKWSYNNEESINYNIKEKITALDTANYKKEFKVRKHDVDMNQHVSNIMYLKWVLESIPDSVTENYFLHCIDGRFISEARYGDTVISFTDKEFTADSFAHTIKQIDNNTVCATGKTVWKLRA